MAKFDSLKSAAQRLDLSNGVSATLRRYTETVADSSKPWRSGTSTSADYTAPMVFLPAGQDDSYLVGELLHQAEIKILVAADDLTIVPNLKDQIINGTDTWSIVNIMKLSPNNQNIYFSLLGIK